MEAPRGALLPARLAEEPTPLFAAMPNGRTDLSKFNNDWYDPGAGVVMRALWYLTNALFLASWLPSSRLKVFLLRRFGASIGRGVVIKPRVNVKYPWRLTVGNHVWIGESVWIDNLADVIVDDHVCLSQGAMLLTGNHNYKSAAFDLIVAPICLESGAWIGAKSIVCPGVCCRSHSVLSVGSVATRDLETYGIYQGNPAVKVRERTIGAVSPDAALNLTNEAARAY
jgi:putative colanic acid biosynthesis acetyltransferase WcaF